jgi:hypothetical protein
MRFTDYGYKVPETDDQDFWAQFEYDIERLDGHNHDGVNSSKIVPGATEPYEVTTAVIDWVGGSAPYYIDIDFPAPWNMTWASGDPCPVQVVVRDAAGTQVFLETTRKAVGDDGLRIKSSVKAIYTVGLY